MSPLPDLYRTLMPRQPQSRVRRRVVHRRADLLQSGVLFHTHGQAAAEAYHRPTGEDANGHPNPGISYRDSTQAKTLQPRGAGEVR